MVPRTVRTQKSHDFCDLYLLNKTCLHYENTKRLQLSALGNADLGELRSSCVADDGLGLLSMHFQFFPAVISTPQKATDVSILQDGII